MRYFDVDEHGREIPRHETLPMAPRYLQPNERDKSEVQDKFNYSVWDLDTWRATRDCEFVVHVDGPRPVGHRGMATIYGAATKRKYTLKAGETAQIPRIYRDAIQKIGPDGLIQSGLCPHLVRVTDGPPAKLHPSIDPSVAPKVAPDLAPDAGRAARLLARAAKAAS
jgi:hypothetical protein